MTDITITISDRDAKALKAFIKANSLDISSYIWDAVSEKFNKDRYGDMNDMVKKPVKKRTAARKTKPKEEAPAEEPKEQPKPVEPPVAEVEPVTEPEATPQEPKKKTTRRVLKIKK